MQSLKKKNLASTFIYDEKIEKGFCQINYYNVHERNIKIYEYLQQEKQCLSIPRVQMITDIIEYYKELEETY